jgi:hypothetical protein
MLNVLGHLRVPFPADGMPKAGELRALCGKGKTETHLIHKGQGLFHRGDAQLAGAPIEAITPLLDALPGQA